MRRGRPRGAPNFLIAQQAIRRRHLRNARHPYIPERDYPLTLGKLLKLDPSRRSRYSQRYREIDVIEIEVTELIRLRIQPENSG